MLRRILLPVLLLAAVIQSFAQAPQANFRISGKTVNAVTGQPLARTEVLIGKAEQFDATLQKVLTGDDGGFAFTGLPAGKYLLGAQRNGFRKQGYEQHGAYVSAVVVGQGLISENLIFRLRPDAWIAGTITDEESEPVPNATIFLFRNDMDAGFKQTFRVAETISDDRGYYRFAHLESGWYFVVVSAEPWFGSLPWAQGQTGADLPPVEKALFDVVYPTTFYPGVADAASASPIAVNEGEGFTADLTLTAVPALRVRVRHIYSDPTQTRSASLQQTVFSNPIRPPSQGERTVDDSVEITGIAPGQYVLDVQSFGPAPSSRSTVIDLSANMEIDANGVTAPSTIRGVVQMDGGPSPLPQAFVRLWNVHTGRMLDAQIGERGEFSFDSGPLAPGNYFVFVINGENSIIGSLSATGAKVVGQSIQVTRATPIRLSIGLSRTLSRINGTARRDGQPFPGAMIVLVPENPETNLPLFRRDQSDSDGTFTLRDVLPGRYRIVAIENGWHLEWANPAVLKTRLDHAERVDIQPNMTYQTVANVE
jgi:hypothetical protein